MNNVVGVCFKPTGKVYYFATRGLSLQPGDQVVTETSKGQELAEVVCTGAHARRKGKLKSILRRATERDIARGQDNRHRAEEARRVCQRLVKQMEMAVKLVDVEYALDGSRITFAFASEDRTDLHELQRRLKEIYDCEVELRQIGVRDQAKILGGLGPCGRHLCCSSFLRSFQPVTIRMAKDQDIALNPTKISGQCGRLMCCLRYEHEAYQEARERLPAVGTEVETPRGRGQVTNLDFLRERVTVTIAEGRVVVPLDEITLIDAKAPEPQPPPVQSPVKTPEAERTEAPKASRRRGSRRRKPRARGKGAPAAAATQATASSGDTEATKKPAAESKPRSRRRGRRRRRPGRSSRGSRDGQGGDT